MSLTTKDGLPISPQNPLPVKVVGERGIVSWHIENEEVATIEDGEIVVVGEGRTEVTANVNGQDYTITLKTGGD